MIIWGVHKQASGGKGLNCCICITNLQAVVSDGETEARGVSVPSLQISHPCGDPNGILDPVSNFWECQSKAKS